MANIDAFKTRMKGGGARANQFQISISKPNVNVPGGSLDDLRFLAKSAQLPASTVADIPVNFRGREVHFAGERSFQPWSIEVYNDTNFAVRNAFESWIDTIQNAESTNGVLDPSQYQVDMEVSQLDRNDRIIKTYTFYNAWPTNVGQIQLDWDANNAIETFSVDFTYNYWVSTDPAIDGRAGAQGSNVPTTAPTTLNRQLAIG